jgi:hypothetical protein
MQVNSWLMVGSTFQINMQIVLLLDFCIEIIYMHTLLIVIGKIKIHPLNGCENNIS